jgi:predicted DNA-binding transcriptional regulator AlpA
MIHQDKRPLFTLTVEEYIELNRNLFNEMPTKTIASTEAIEERDIIYLKEATALTGYTDKTVYTKVCRREIPVISSGRPLTFSRKQLNEWMANGRPSIAEMIANDYTNPKNQQG